MLPIRYKRRSLSIEDRVAAAVERMRWDAELTQKALADKSGVSRSTLSKIENGKIDPSVNTLHCLVKGLGRTLVELFEIVEDELEE